MQQLKNVLAALAVIIATYGSAQLPDGSIAPDFTLDDIVDSNTYNLYSYLDQGKTCFIEIFAAHCPGCWSYHQAGALKDLYNAHGPNGTDEIMVFALEYDEFNFYDAFIGIGPAWVTAGNWLTGTPYPIFQVEGTDRSVFSDYNVTAYPLVFMVCPNRILKRVSTALDASALYDGISDCAWLNVDENLEQDSFFVFGKELILKTDQQVTSVKALNLQGQVVLEAQQMESNSLSLQNMKPGVYLFQITTDSVMTIHSFQVD